MIKILKNNQGSSLIGAIVVMTILAGTAASVATISSSDTKRSVNDLQMTQVRAVGTAGIEHARNKLKQGYCPDVNNKAFGPGSFTTTTNPTSGAVTVVAQVGDAKVSQSINTEFTQDCVSMNCVFCTMENAAVKDLQFTKSCNDQAILTDLVITRNWTSCDQTVNCDGTTSTNSGGETVYEDVGNPPNNKFWICHVPPGNPENRHTLAVNINGWENGHSGGNGSHNMDYLGPCIISGGEEGGTTTTTQTCEETPASMVALENCVEDTSTTTLIQVDLANTTIFENGAVPDNNTTATTNGANTDVADSAMTDDGIYLMDMIFSEEVPEGGWITIEAIFADGSTLTETVKVGSSTGSTPPNSGGEGEGEGESETPAEEGFEVQDGVVIIDSNYKVDMEVIGSAITCGPGGSEIEVSTKLCINNNCSNLWSGNDVDGGETHSTTNSQANSEYKIEAKAKSKSCGNFSQTYDSTNTVQVRTLKHGEQAPPLQGFGGQKSVQDFLSDYIDENGKVVLDADQVIMLFELGVDLANDPTSSAADFQDLVLLMTISEIAE
jgi:hypothetical protein